MEKKQAKTGVKNSTGRDILLRASSDKKEDRISNL